MAETAVTMATNRHHICAGRKAFLPTQKGECTAIQGILCRREMSLLQEVRSNSYVEDLPPPYLT